MLPRSRTIACIPALLAVFIVGACTKPATRKYAYTCPDGHEFTISYSDQRDAGDVAVLVDESGTLQLPRAPADSGERYTNESTVFQIEGDSASIEKSGKVRHQGCTT